jgi:hypothetical protein
VQQDGRLRLQAPHSQSGVCQEDCLGDSYLGVFFSFLLVILALFSYSPIF